LQHEQIRGDKRLSKIDPTTDTCGVQMLMSHTMTRREQSFGIPTMVVEFYCILKVIAVIAAQQRVFGHICPFSAVRQGRDTLIEQKIIDAVFSPTITNMISEILEFDYYR
jgi:hypothetical protein